MPKKPKVIDYRKQKETLFFGQPLWDGWIPDGVTNEVIPIISMRDDKETTVGEIQIGSDGFIEAMFFIKGGLAKIKRFPKEKKLYIGDW
jgi:hypothetical protein